MSIRNASVGMGFDGEAFKSSESLRAAIAEETDGEVTSVIDHDGVIIAVIALNVDGRETEFLYRVRPGNPDSGHRIHLEYLGPVRK